VRHPTSGSLSPIDAPLFLRRRQAAQRRISPFVKEAGSMEEELGFPGQAELARSPPHVSSASASTASPVFLKRGASFKKSNNSGGANSPRWERARFGSPG
jgi:hypothetical protein